MNNTLAMAQVMIKDGMTTAQKEKLIAHVLIEQRKVENILAMLKKATPIDAVGTKLYRKLVELDSSNDELTDYIGIQHLSIRSPNTNKTYKIIDYNENVLETKGDDGETHQHPWDSVEGWELIEISEQKLTY